jgi:ParB family chromosome partitioning protein
MRQAISINSIEPNPFQSRKAIDRSAVEALAKSIQETGFWDTALRVRSHNGNYQLVWGHQRLEALKRLGHKRVDVEVTKLDDTTMAEESLIENIQRTNLPEIDKADAIARVVKMEMANTRSSTNRVDAVERVMTLLGYKSRNSIEEYLAMAGMTDDTKKVLRQHNTARGAVRAARIMGGEKMVRHAARERISQRDLEPMGQDLAELPKESRAKVVEKIVQEKITAPQAVTRLVRREQERAVDKDRIPPDLLLFIDKWTGDLAVWTKKLHAAGKHRNYIHEHPEVATRFRDAAEKFITALKEVVDLR